MPNFVDRAAEKKIAEQTMTVRGHCNQIALLLRRRFQNAFRRITQREISVDVQSASPQIRGRVFQISAVMFHFVGLNQIQLVVVSRDESVRDMYEQQIRAVQFRELGDVRQKLFVRATVFESDQDFFIHG